MTSQVETGFFHFSSLFLGTMADTSWHSIAVKRLDSLMPLTILETSSLLITYGKVSRCWNSPELLAGRIPLLS